MTDVNITRRKPFAPVRVAGWDAFVGYLFLIVLTWAPQVCRAGAPPDSTAPPLELAGHSAGVRWLAFAPDDKTLASASDDGNLKIWDLSNGQVRTTIGELQQGARLVAYSRDGRQLACTDGHNDVHVYDVASSREVQHHSEDLGGIPLDLLYVKGGTTLANIDSHYGLQLWLWDAAGKRSAQHRTVAPTFLSMDLSSAVLSPDSKTLAAVADRQIRVFDLSSGQEKKPLANGDSVQCLAISPDSRLLAGPGINGITHLWELSSGREVMTLHNYGQPLASWAQPDQIAEIAFAPDGRLLVAGGGHLLVVWDVASGRLLFTTQPADMGQIFSVALSQDDKSVAYGMNLGQIYVTRLTSGSASHASQAAPVAQSGAPANPFAGQVSQVISAPANEAGGQLSQVISHPAAVSQIPWSAGQPMPTRPGVIGQPVPTGPGVIEQPAVHQFGEQNEPGRLQTGNSLIEYVIFSPDGHTLAGAAGLGVDLFQSTGRKIASLDLRHAMLLGMLFTSDGKRLVTVNSTDVAQTWDSATGKELASFHMEHPGPAPALGVAAVARDGRTVALAGMAIENMRTASSVVEIWDISSGKHRTLSKGDFRTATQLMAFAPDSRLLAVAEQSGPARIWDIRANKQTATLPLSQQAMLCDLVFSPDSKELATEGYDSQVIVWDAASGKQLASAKAGNAGPHRLGFTSDGKWLAILDVNQVRLWDYASNREIVGTSGVAAQQSFSTLAVSPSGNAIALGVQGDGIEVQQLAVGAMASATTANQSGLAPAPNANVAATPRELFMVKAHDQPLHDLAFSSDGKLLVTAGNDNSIKTWDIPSGKPRLTLGHQWVGWVSISPDGKRIASATDRNAATTKLWDAGTGRPLVQLATFGPVEFSPDGRTLATGGQQQLTFWDLATTRPLLEVRHPYPILDPLVFSSDGRVLAWFDNRAVHLTETANGSDLAVITGHVAQGQSFNSMSHFAFANGRVIACREQADQTTGGRAMLAFDERGQPLGRVPIDVTQYSVTSLKFAPGGRVLALVLAYSPPPYNPNMPVLKNPAGHDEIWLCDASSGRKLAVLSNFVSASGTVVALSADGRYMAVGEGLGELHLYDVSGFLNEASGRRSLLHSLGIK